MAATLADYRTSTLLIGAGNMGGAMLRRWVEAGLARGCVTVVDPAAAHLPQGVVALSTIPPALPAPVDVVVLAVKPQQLANVAAAIDALMTDDTLLISILAGTDIAALRARFPRARAVARVMPNLPVTIARGISAVHADGLDEGQRACLHALLSVLGAIEVIDRESLFDAVTGVSGSGPAFLFRFIEAMAGAGARLGLDPDQARRLAIGTVEGAARLAAQADVPPGTLADRVTSAGGTTAAGLAIMDEDDALNTLVFRTIEAAAKRSAELARL